MSQQTELSNKVVLVTGSSTGIGRLTAETLARAGLTVYATMRDLESRNAPAAAEIRELAGRERLALHVLELDVTHGDSTEDAVAAVIREEGHIDVVVNNAGAMNAGVTEGFTLEQIQSQMDVNFFGAARLNRAVLPHMRTRGSGLLVHVSSLAGRLVFPFFGVYCASKFALEALAESYRYELSGIGIDSVIVEPGPFASELIARSPKPADRERLESYGDTAAIPERTLASFSEFLRGPDAPDPQTVADDILRLIGMPMETRPLRTVCGVDYGLRKMNEVMAPFQRELLGGLGQQHMDPAR